MLRYVSKVFFTVSCNQNAKVLRSRVGVVCTSQQIAILSSCSPVYIAANICQEDDVSLPISLKNAEQINAVLTKTPDNL
jgi:hypothetical protein